MSTMLEAVRNSYLAVDPVTSSPQQERMRGIVARSNERRSQNPDIDLQTQFVLQSGTQVAPPILEWEGREADYQVFDELVLMVCSSGDMTDKEFVTDFLPRIERCAAQSHLFKLLNDPSILTSAVHHHTPMRHVFRVMGELRVDQLSYEQRIKVRFQALMHDLGKIFIADQDFFQDHARLSYVIVMDYLSQRLKFDSHAANAFAAGILFHHIDELLDKNVMTDFEFSDSSLLRSYQVDPDLLHLIRVLSIADCMSVDAYRCHALKALEKLVEIADTILAHLRNEIFATIRIYVHGFRDRNIDDLTFATRLEALYLKVA